jgi:hypothetical protein
MEAVEDVLESVYNVQFCRKMFSGCGTTDNIFQPVYKYICRKSYIIGVMYF